ncbi:purine-binding chemotaxis protein CheW [Bacillus sp. ISL-18]|uniref:chemotaxis protein CheW n=1 Tax=Bacillus sp. ISL-18 TaxID=2819118 RepID=UPI001BEB4EB2|nr:chemotaxis protein CheW [Bacillus sp. ISL-18]MBT2657805.1 purine-binding chemotaxis protein CheW [Bacillus sp. ISL-18]
MGIMKIVAFKLGEEEYGLDINHVQSIERIEHITRVPNAPAYVKGVMNLRGNVTPVIDLSSKLEMGQSNYTETSRVIMTKIEDIELGMIVDQTSDVIDIAPEHIESAAGSFESTYFNGIAKIDGRLIILLKLEEIMKNDNE